MIQVRAGAPEGATPGYVRRTAHIESAAGIDDIWFLTPVDTRPLSDDWLLAVGTIVGMTLGEDVHVAGTVSERLLGSIEEIQRITELRHAGIRPVRVTTDGVATTPRAGTPRTTCCFSCGVDSFYTALEIDGRIDEFLYVSGFETYPHEERVLAHLLPNVRAAANGLRKPLRLVESNWRHVLEPITGHTYYVSMPMVFASVQLMGSELTRLIVPGTHDPLFDDVDHPSSIATLVRLWSTEGVENVEHGHVPRFEKVRRVARSDVAMRHLRICWNQQDPLLNCGRCTKCFRTRVHLTLAGAEGRCATLPPRLRPEEIRRARPETPQHLNYIDENIAEAESKGLRELAEALRVQRGNQPPSPTPAWAQLTRLGLFLRNLARSVRRRHGDARVRQRKRQVGQEHLFNCFAADP